MNEYERLHAYDFGLPLETNEIPREKFISRLSSDEKDSLKSVCRFMTKHWKESPFEVKSTFGMLAVGSSTYSDSYYANLESYFSEHGLTRNDTIKEVALITGGDPVLALVAEHETYASFSEAFEKLRGEDPFAGFFDVSEASFLKTRSHFQKEYEVEKSIESILDNKGEDVDILLAPDEPIHSPHLHESSTYALQSLSRHYDAPIEQSRLSNHGYMFDSYGKVTRYKTISGAFANSISIPTSDRRVHLYISCTPLDFHIRRCVVDNVSFSRLARYGCFGDFSVLL
jgi:hypothetical protein